MRLQGRAELLLIAPNRIAERDPRPIAAALGRELAHCAGLPQGFVQVRVNIRLEGGPDGVQSGIVGHAVSWKSAGPIRHCRGFPVTREAAPGTRVVPRPGLW